MYSDQEARDQRDFLSRQGQGTSGGGAGQSNQRDAYGRQGGSYQGQGFYNGGRNIQNDQSGPAQVYRPQNGQSFQQGQFRGQDRRQQGNRDGQNNLQDRQRGLYQNQGRGFQPNQSGQNYRNDQNYHHDPRRQEYRQNNLQDRQRGPYQNQDRGFQPNQGGQNYHHGPRRQEYRQNNQDRQRGQYWQGNQDRQNYCQDGQGGYQQGQHDNRGQQNYQIRPENQDYRGQDRQRGQYQNQGNNRAFQPRQGLQNRQNDNNYHPAQRRQDYRGDQDSQQGLASRKEMEPKTPPSPPRETATGEDLFAPEYEDVDFFRVEKEEGEGSHEDQNGHPAQRGQDYHEDQGRHQGFHQPGSSGHHTGQGSSYQKGRGFHFQPSQGQGHNYRQEGQRRFHQGQEAQSRQVQPNRGHNNQFQRGSGGQDRPRFVPTANFNQAEAARLAAAAKADRLREWEEALEKKKKEIEECGPMDLVYHPDELSLRYMSHKDLATSVKIFAEMSNLSLEEARPRLLEILGKVSLVEAHLSRHGEISAKQLFKAMKSANRKEKKPKMPSSAPQEKEPEENLFEPEDDEFDFFKSAEVKEDEEEEDDEEDEEEEENHEDEEEEKREAAEDRPQHSGEIRQDDSGKEEVEEPSQEPKDKDSDDSSSSSEDSEEDSEVHSEEDSEEDSDEERNAIPFSSPEELSSFMESMTPVFRYRRSCHRWRNTGVQTRRFFQWLKKEMDGCGSEKNDELKDFEEFKKTIVVEDESSRFLAERELMLDYSSYLGIGHQVPGFAFDSETGFLSLTSEARNRLPLNLPILSLTLHSYNPSRMDASRKESMTIWQKKCSTNGRSHGVICTGPLKGGQAINYRKRFIKELSSDKSTMLSITGYIWPVSSAVEAFHTEALVADPFNSITLGSHQLTIVNGKEQKVLFESIGASLRIQEEDNYNIRPMGNPKREEKKNKLLENMEEKEEKEEEEEEEKDEKEEE